MGDGFVEYDGFACSGLRTTIVLATAWLSVELT